MVEDEDEHGYDEHDHSEHDHSEEEHSNEVDVRPPFAAAEDSSKSGSESISKVNIIVSTCIMTLYLITK